MSEVKIQYIIGEGSENEQNFQLYFASKDMSLLDKSFEGHEIPPAEWAELDKHKCEHCPLSTEENKYCPAALSLGRIAHQFADVKSHTETNVSVITQERTYTKKTSTQEALHSIFGLVMATSECPHLNFFRPMARFHLPFASLNETMVRSLSFFLLHQYFTAADPKLITFDLKPLSTAYDNIQIVNLNIAERIRQLGKGDADVNAIVILDAFASLLSLQISVDFADLRPLFIPNNQTQK